MSTVINIEQFFVGKTFVIPVYQRDYAWTIAQVDELFEDIDEAIVTDSAHYFGTVVLSHTQTQDHFEIVDGQQRLATLILVIHALLEELPLDNRQRIADTLTLLEQDNNDLKLNFGKNKKFVDSLLGGKLPNPETPGQRKLRKTYEHARERAKALFSQGREEKIIIWMKTIKKLEIMHFVAENTGRAIRVFQTVNDRGLPLSYMEKAKALLVYYSNRYLDGKLDSEINDRFGRCFAAFDSIQQLVSNKKVFSINTLTSERFSEDDMLRYHYLSYSFPHIEEGGDYKGSIQTVFESFLKKTLKKFATNHSELHEFIQDYIDDLRAFCEAFKQVVFKAKTDSRIYKYFGILGVSTRLYPLTIRLHQRKMLFEKLGESEVDLLECLETCDVRVYKTRGTDPAKDIGNLSHISRTASAQDIANKIRQFIVTYMPDWNFQVHLEAEMYHNQALRLMLLNYDEDCAGKCYDISALQNFVIDDITREHILSRTPDFDITTYNFDDENDFEAHLHQLGNMTLLTKSENSRCRNANIHTKMTEYYPSSCYAGTRHLAQEYSAGNQQFHKKNLKQRTQKLSKWIQSRWPLW